MGHPGQKPRGDNVDNMPLVQAYINHCKYSVSPMNFHRLAKAYSQVTSIMIVQLQSPNHRQGIEETEQLWPVLHIPSVDTTFDPLVCLLGSHPSTARTEQELNKLKTWETSTTQTAETICNSLSGMEEMYKCMDGLLSLPLTQQVLSQHHHEAWADELLDKSFRLLNACSSTKDVISQLKEHVINIQSSLRRRKGESSTGSSIVRFTSFRKKMKKDTKRLIAALKQMDNQIEMATPWHTKGIVKKNPSRWSTVAKLILKGTVCENQLDSVNDLERLDAALCAICKCTSSEEEKMQIAQSRLDALEGCIEGFENGLVHPNETDLDHLILDDNTFLWADGTLMSTELEVAKLNDGGMSSILLMPMKLFTVVAYA
ncbi:hypothetical protein RJ639_005198 [Escallonia herrerae]|uniref:Uncharacterized protein n=1 Tax=Escallonia herrerae TaxID=1293975 RepID=A0AA89AXD8_9ASTE|nr:hypothetical protein RJ639_005198 [Escallonia herrerae]